MRARNIKPGFFVNEQLAECCFAARILFEGLWCLADREGRLEDKPKKIKALVFPYDDINADELLQELHTHGLIVRYEVDGAKYIDIPKFRVHQRPHQNETASVIPPREEPLASKSEEVGTKDERTCDQGKKDFAPKSKALRPESLILNTESLNPELKALRACARGGGDQQLLLTDFTPEETEIVRLFSGVNGLKFDAQKLVQQTRDLGGEYPNVNILSEVKKMALWLDCADGKKKSGKGNLLLFVRNWIERADKTPSPPLRELDRKRDRSMSLRNADGTFGDLTPEEEAEQQALEERYRNLDEEGNRIT